MKSYLRRYIVFEAYYTNIRAVYFSSFQHLCIFFVVAFLLILCNRIIFVYKSWITNTFKWILFDYCYRKKCENKIIICMHIAHAWHKAHRTIELGWFVVDKFTLIHIVKITLEINTMCYDTDEQGIIKTVKSGPSVYLRFITIQIYEFNQPRSTTMAYIVVAVQWKLSKTL